jgi:crotonobetainyl-CoA:carnitine CoA-transferase CaiB-like acyl-CoA transferase
MPGALDDVKVVDFGHYIAGPLLAELLAQNGADVIHVDPPGGPRLKGLPDAYLNRGKRRITLDLTTAEDRRVAQELIQSADVVVENFRPGVMDRLGLGPGRMLPASPRLVYCSLPGFAHDDPRASVPSWEGVVMSATAGYRRLRDHWDWQARSNAVVDDPERPLFSAIPVASTTAAMLGALRVAVALLRRDETGRGGWLEVPLSEAMLEVVGFHLEFPGFVGASDAPPKPFLGSYLCADGGYVDQVSYPRFVEKFLVAAGVWADWKAAGFSDMAQVFADPTLRTEADRRFADLILTRPSTVWEAIVTELRIPFARVRTADEWLASNHARESGMVAVLDDPEFGPVSMAGTAIHFSRTPATISQRTLPNVDRQQVLDDLRNIRIYPDPSTAKDDPAPLAGVSVVEFSQVVAGPIAGRLLADFGADVIKVANPSPAGNNGFHGSFTNRGKRTAFLDVQDPADQGVLRSAIREADVLLQNYAYGAMERYGFGFDTLSAERPDLVYVSLSAFSREGPWKGRRGHENQAVAATGLSARYGGPQGWPIYQPYLVSDVGTGILGAFATVLGLYERNRSGLGQHISTSLAQVATIHQGIYLFDGPQHGRLPEPSGTSARGWTAFQRLYEASDGWLFVAAAPKLTEAFMRVTGLVRPGPVQAAGDEDDLLAEAASAVIRARPSAHWISAFGPEGIVAQPVREIDDVAQDPTWHRRGVLRYGRNGEGTHGSPILGTGSPGWPVPQHVLPDPGPLGSATSDIRHQFQPTKTIAI